MLHCHQMIAPSADIDRQLSDVQSRIRDMEARRLQTDRQHHASLHESDTLVRRCNELYDEVQPLNLKEAHLIKANRIACRAGLAGSCMLGLGPGLMSMAPMLSLGITLVDIGLLAGAFFTVEYSKRKLREISPQADSLNRQWIHTHDRLEAVQRDARDRSRELRAWDERLRTERSKEQVLLVAHGVSLPAPPPRTIQEEDEAIVIGNVRVPRRTAPDLRNP